MATEIYEEAQLCFSSRNHRLNYHETWISNGDRMTFTTGGNGFFYGIMLECSIQGPHQKLPRDLDQLLLWNNAGMLHSRPTSETTTRLGSATAIE
uniref:Uncharacterized protein n=1 Tax=Ditylenchus dipsaci TaxID=166011 RepID=A0A915E275_9BILA